MSDLRSRLNKIIDLHGKALSEAVGKREPKEAQLSTKDLILRFAGSDPTDGKSRTQWLVKTYIQDEQFKLEDLGRVDAALAAFERFKRKLPVEQRELSRFKKLRDLEALVDPFVKAEAKARLERDLSSATGRELRRLEELKARDESIIMQEGDSLSTIAVPMTEFSSKWWGRGTKWCTAAEKDNRFAQYHKDAPLIVIVCPDGEKFQMHVKKNDFQFMDNTDAKVGKKIIQERWNEFQSIFYWTVEQNGEALKNIPEDKRSIELCRIAIEQNGKALEYVTKDQRTPELCRLAIEQNGKALEYVTKDQITPELCLLAIQQNVEALQFVPEKYKTTELCYIAVQQNGGTLQFVPEEDKTTELCHIAVQQKGWALSAVPIIHKTPELCLLAVERNGWALSYVPEEKITTEICRIAVKQTGWALRDVPKNKMTPELCHIAVEQNGETLRFVPEKDRTLELCRIAIEQNGMALHYVPKDKITYELCRIAVEQNGEALKFIIVNKRTPELCRLAVEQNGGALYHVPAKLQTPELLALVPPVQPKWSVDILKGLGYQSQALQNSKTNHMDNNTLFNHAQ
jgi:Domain of unknown function (DUF4116)